MLKERTSKIKLNRTAEDMEKIRVLRDEFIKKSANRVALFGKDFINDKDGVGMGDMTSADIRLLSANCKQFRLLELYDLGFIELREDSTR